MLRIRRVRSGTAASIRAVAPDLIVNAAFRQSDWATTADGAANAALAAAEVGARLVFVSSDAVFSGDSSPYCGERHAGPDHAVWRCQGCCRDGGRCGHAYGGHRPDLADHRPRRQFRA
ncbi:sugar nucleotide-binding protein [Occultella gossypii]|uniref:sugar nucleotide-binding protein n=1 Tax=Occultella gossypii TaxID=2800820 RepID=UPI003557F8A6